MSTFSKTESTAEALAAVFEEINRLKSEPPSAEELRKSKAFIVGNFPLDRETPQQMASELWLLATNSLPQNYFEQELRSIAAAGEPDCMSLISKAVRPEQMVVVVVGSAEKLKDGLEKTAPVSVIEAKE